MNTFYQLWKVSTPEQALKKIESQRICIEKPKNLEEQALSLVGKDIYYKLIKGYTEKQWGRNAASLPADIIKRIPLRYTFDNNYFNDAFQGIPEGGYNTIIDKLLDGIEVKTGTDFFENREYFTDLASKIVYTGRIDEFFHCRFGELEYRSLRFDTQRLEKSNFQGNAVINYTEREVPYTRIIEHKHFEKSNLEHTVITYEYPAEFIKGSEPYYPINDLQNNRLSNQYGNLAKEIGRVIFCGRLAEYKYYDMDDTIESALNIAEAELK